MTEIETTKAGQVAGSTIRVSFPFGVLLTVGLGIAKWGLAASIPLWFVLLPMLWWVYLLIGMAAICVGVLALGSVLGLCYLAWSLLASVGSMIGSRVASLVRV